MHCIILAASICLFVLDKSQSRDIHVALLGEDRTDCGATENTPCFSIEGALQTAKAHDVIRLDGTDQSSHDNAKFCIKKPLFIERSITITRHRGKPQIDCIRDRLLGNFSTIWIGFRNATAAANILPVVKWIDVTIFNSNWTVNMGNITIENCTLHNVNINGSTNRARIPVHFLKLNITNTDWYGDANDICLNKCETASSFQMARGMQLILRMENCRLYQTWFKWSVYYADVYITNSFFSNLPSKKLIIGGIYASIHYKAESRVVVRNSRFENQYFDYPISSVMNLYLASLLILCTAPKDQKLSSNLTAIITNTHFNNNERGLTFIGPFKDIFVERCSFQNNVAMHAGAAILFLTYETTEAYISNCGFINNAAGTYRTRYVLDYKKHFQVTGDEVIINSDCCKGMISFVGKGGAIRIQRGIVHVEDSTFKNNTASLLGGAVFVDRNTKMFINNSWFENTPSHDHSLQGDVVYSNGEVLINGAKIRVNSASSHVAVIRHSGDHWSIEISEISIECPVGYRLRVTNTSAYGVSSVGLKRSHKLDQIAYFCESCPRNKYSLDYGYLNYSFVFTEYAYFTLLINGSRPPQTFNGTYTYHDITCIDCPYGGRCANGITAIPNFWGYITKNASVKFQHCPKGYCCSNTTCPEYNKCAENRVGRLCGRCRMGYSEALFSPHCVPDETCNPALIWPFAFTSGLIYALFLLFQKDMRDMMYFNMSHLQKVRVCGKDDSRVALEDSNHIAKAACNSIPAPGQSPVTDLADLEHLPNDTMALTTKNLTNVNHNDEKYFNTDEDELEYDELEPPAVTPPADTGASFLIILFYYFQDAQLLHIKTVFTSAESKSTSILKEILSGLFKFRLEFFQFLEHVCFIRNISPSGKLLVKAVLVPYVLFQFLLMYLVYRCCCSRTSDKLPNKNLSTTKDDEPKKTFLAKLSTGFILALLFTYQKLAQTSFTLLNCVPVGAQSVLFIEGGIVCYQYWQWGVMAYAVSCIVPFCMVLLMGPGLIKDGLISLPQFFCACLLPLPFLVYWFVMRLRLAGRRPEKDVELSEGAKSVLQILQGPFKESESRILGPTCGAGLMIGRRLILVLLFTFVNDILLRMLCMIFVCFIILLHHLHVLPYKDFKGNFAGTMSASALLFVGGINLVRSCFESAEYEPLGPNQILMQVFEEVENILMLWFPAVVMAFVLIAVFVKLNVLFICPKLRQLGCSRH